MNRVRQILVILIAVGVAGWLAWRAWGPHPEDRVVLSGYIEGEYLYLSAPISGFVARVDVARGDRAVAGQQVFAMDDAPLRAQRDQAAANLAQAQAQIESAQAKLMQSRATAAAAQAQAVNAAEDLKRYRSALRVNAETVSRQQVDTAVATAAASCSPASLMAARGDVAAQESQIAAAKAQAAAQQAVHWPMWQPGWRSSSRTHRPTRGCRTYSTRRVNGWRRTNPSSACCRTTR